MGGSQKLQKREQLDKKERTLVITQEKLGLFQERILQHQLIVLCQREEHACRTEVRQLSSELGIYQRLGLWLWDSVRGNQILLGLQVIKLFILPYCGPRIASYSLQPLLEGECSLQASQLIQCSRFYVRDLGHISLGFFGCFANWFNRERLSLNGSNSGAVVLS